MTSNMNDFKTIGIYGNLPIFAYFFKRQEDFSFLLKKSNIFKYHSMCQTHTFYAHLYLCVVYILFAPVILTSIHRCYQNPEEGY